VSRSDVYAGLHAKLLRGYAVDAIEHPVDAPVPMEFIEKLMRQIVRAKREPVGLVGLGQATTFNSPRFSGTELVLGDELVAWSVFPA
jgi:hypothetical protein